MCSSRGVCGGNRPNRSSNSGGSAAHYALCALGVGLIALGIVMIVWTVIPMESSSTSSPYSGNVTVINDNANKNMQPSTVAFVLVGVGVVILLLSIFLGVRSKRRDQSRSNPTEAARAGFTDHTAGEEGQPAVHPTTYNVPSYEEVVGSSNYPVRQSNLRQTTSHLPSYEDIIAAVENERADPPNNSTESAPLNDAPPAQPAAEPQPGHASLTSNPSLPARSSSRASRLLRPLRVRRIKSDKLHLKDFRLQIRTPTQNPVTIEPITPPPQYDTKMPELQ
ncbi:transmembrane protein 51b [Melanotaenia boesemani]|uniref:transmembrane protein 51b n=1 Tax=Melanotaenia boesemani TaxID=1250792 RepID=UPI001C042CB9|nr:transmembrane protein 51b [Melanotaenia boesemani]XP_041837423.1 transmembrane protein 51b [Melanotaenia boesemani]